MIEVYAHELFSTVMIKFVLCFTKDIPETLIE